MSILNPPEKFDFARPADWPEWRQRFERYRTVTKLNKETDEEIQISGLIYSMGREAEHIFKSFAFATAGDEKKYSKVMQKFDEYFIPKRNIIHERACFHERKQAQGESVECFVRALYELLEHCNFTNKEEEIRDQLVIGIHDKELSEKLQLTADLTLEKALDMSRQTEQVKSQMRDQIKHVDAVRSSHGKQFSARHSKPRGSSQSARPQPKQQSQTQCTRCNKQDDKARCPAQGKRCRLCNKLNHFAVCCHSNSHAVREVVCDQPTESDQFFLGSITNCDGVEEAWTVGLTICGKHIKFKIDTGADISIISEHTYDSFPVKPKLLPVNSILQSPGGTIDCRGKFVAFTNYKGNDYQFTVFVTRGSQQSNLLGRSVADRLSVIQRVEEINSVFGTSGLLQCEPVRMTLRDDAEPYCVTTPRRIAFPLMSKVEAELMRMKREGIIEEVTEPTEWCAPIVPVVKKNNKIRICVDLKKLNEAVKREHYMLLTLDDIAPKLVGAKYFSKLDASNGFYQIPLELESARFTTFITPFGRFCFRRVPFGITSAPEIFQRKMSDLLRDLDGVEAIIDDTLVFGRTVEEHDDRLNKVSARIHDSDLKLNKEKCEFRKPQLRVFRAYREFRRSEA